MNRRTTFMLAGVALFAYAIAAFPEFGLAPAFGQTVAPAVGPASVTQSTASVPDLSGIWSRPYFGVEPPPSGPGPVMARPGNRGRIVGDHTNPILKPHAAEVVKKHGEIEVGGVAVPNPRNQCWPEGLPFIFTDAGMQILQQPNAVTIVYDHDHQVRRVRLNEAHPAQVTPSWYGNSVGHWEGDTLLIDTVGIKVGPLSMLDMFGTPHSSALHVVERYSLIEYQAALEVQERTLKTRPSFPETPPPGGDAGLHVDPDYKGRGLQLQFTVEDQGVFTTPWSATVTYRRGVNWRGSQEWPEVVCAENVREYYDAKDTAVPHADKPDF
jgi:hypothetical protein